MFILDINECSNNSGGCSHNCINKIGGFDCTCYNGYKLDSDSRSCNGKNLFCNNMVDLDMEY